MSLLIIINPSYNFEWAHWNCYQAATWIVYISGFSQRWRNIVIIDIWNTLWTWRRDINVALTLPLQTSMIYFEVNIFDVEGTLVLNSKFDVAVSMLRRHCDFYVPISMLQQRFHDDISGILWIKLSIKCWDDVATTL